MVDVRPVYNVPPFVDVGASVVFVLEVVCVFPDVDSQEDWELGEVHEILFLDLGEDELVCGVVVEK